MRKLLIASAVILALTACKKDKNPTEKAAKPAAPNVQQLAEKSLAGKGDWSRDIDIYVDNILTCANAAPGSAKYIFQADAFETPAISLILLKTEDDRVYGCTLKGDGSLPEFTEIKVKPNEKSARFYPGALPKPDSCLNNTRVLDHSGHTAGWLSKITC